LAPSRFAAKTPVCPYWILLDFLGFSRQNRDLSMGYTGFSLEIFSSRFVPGVRSAGDANPRSWKAKAQDCSWNKLSLPSAFPQQTVCGRCSWVNARHSY
jgi:hypothetical protein